MAKKGLDRLGVLTYKSGARLASLVSTLEYLSDLCNRQVANKPLTEAENAFLAFFPSRLKQAIGDVDDKGLRTTLVADVHTDLNSKQSLEEGSGYVDLLVVAYQRPEGDVVLAVGPVLSYYEFKQPMKERLTDEEWRARLFRKEPPLPPAWTRSFTRPGRGTRKSPSSTHDVPTSARHKPAG